MESTLERPAMSTPVRPPTPTTADHVRRMLAWIDEHNAADDVISLDSSCTGQRICISTIDAFRRLFAGKNAKRHRADNYDVYEIRCEGICFSCFVRVEAVAASEVAL